MNIISIKDRTIIEKVEECVKRNLITREEADCWCGIIINEDHEDLKKYAKAVKEYYKKHRKPRHPKRRK